MNGEQNMKKNAFTLAEVLLTLAIIGVVAALTIPAVITKVTKDQYVVGLKKAYNTLKAVEREAIQEHGPMENWSWSTGDDPTADFERYFKPHFDILKDCGATTEKGCWAEEPLLLGGDRWGGGSNFDTERYYRIVTSDGMSFAYFAYGAAPPMIQQGIFFVDVNGLKGPNRWGRDIFQFDVFSSNLGIKPECSYTYDGIAPILTSEVDSYCVNPLKGFCCATKVLSEGAMNY